MPLPDPPSFPAYPTNGAPLDERTPPKIGPWVWTPKIDDWHGLIHTPTMRVWNQYGEPSSIEHKFKTALAYLHAGWSLPGHWILDGPSSFLQWLDVGLMENRHDMMRGCIVVFDLIPVHQPAATYAERRRALESVFTVLPWATDLARTERDHIFLIPQFDCGDDLDRRHGHPLGLDRSLQTQNEKLGRKFYEGLVAKRTDKPYPIQLRKPKEPTPWMMKHRFDQ